jgi:hypothetical protein
LLPYASSLVAVTDEQRALLQLLLEGGQSYDDIGSLLGIGPEEVRSRARSALTDIGGADPDAQVGLSDYLLGQADPIGRADAVRHLQSDPDANALAQRLVQNLRLLAPKAQLPEIPAAKGGRRAAPAPPPPASSPAGTEAPPPTAPPATPPQPSVPPSPGFASRAAGAISGLGRLEGKRRTQAIVGAAAALAIVIVLIVVVTGGGGGGGSSDCKSIDSAAPQQAGVPTIKLTAAGASVDADCPPGGQMVLGAQQSQQQQQQQSNSQQPTYVLQANAVNLPPTNSSDRYVLWLYRSDTQAVPLGQETVSDSGDLNGGVPLAAQQVLLLPAFTQVRFSKVTQAEAQQVQQSLQAQRKKQTGIVQFVGEPVLQGNISELGLNQLLQQAQSQAGGSAGGAAGGSASGSGKKG